MVKRLINGTGFGATKLSHVLMLILGICLVLEHSAYHERMNSIGQVMVLIIYLGALIGVAPVAMPTFRSKFWQTFFVSSSSMILDSYPVLEQTKGVKVIDSKTGEEFEEAYGGLSRLYALFVLGALTCGLCLWFGEAYAAGLYNNNGRTGVLSALFIVPPAFAFVIGLGIHASLLPVEIVVNGVGMTRTQKLGGYIEANFQYLLIFGAGIVGLLTTHNPLLCLGIMLVLATLSNKAEQVLDIVRNRIEIDIILVLLIALVGGPMMVEFVNQIGMGQGNWRPIFPSSVQAVLWGPLYDDPTVHFWIRMTNLSTGAMLTPVSSLVGVMLFKNKDQWLTYMKFSLCYAPIWYFLMRGWIYIALESPFGTWAEQFAHVGGH